MTQPESVKILAFAGSLRRGSYNRALVRAAAEAPRGLEIDIYDISDIPLYNYDLEIAGDPGPVRAFKEAVDSADGLLIATPEYNHGTAGVTKNVIDWASRPPRASVLNRKPVGIMGASGGPWGTARGQSQLRQAFVFTNSYAMPQPQLLVPHAGDKFDQQGNLIDEGVRSSLRHFLEAFGEWVRLFMRAAHSPEGRA
ncbi:MAG: NAD(P)H-dependent FMN reductase [Thermoleophilia bacterium]